MLAAVVGLLWITGCMERLFYQPTAGPTPPAEGPPGTEAVWFTSSDGTRLFGWWIPASGRRIPASGRRIPASGRRIPASGDRPEDTRAPTILHVHGNAGNIVSHQWFTAHLPPAGFNVFLFDYRGYGQSEGAARRRESLIRDTHAALDALLARPDVDPQRVGLYGQSLGGGIALDVMAGRPELKAAVIESAFTSWRRIAANAVGGDPPPAPARWAAALLIRDGDRPLDAIARIDRPLLLLHGSADTIVPVRHSRDLAAAGPRAELVILDGGEHNSLRDTHPEVDRLMIEFYRTHLP